MEPTTVIIHPNLSMRDRKKIVEPLINESTVLKILSIDKNDVWYKYPELLGKEGRFVFHRVFLSVFVLKEPILLDVGGSISSRREFLFSGANFELIPKLHEKANR